MEFKVEQGDLFEVDRKYCLTHCISSDVAMGAGIAKEFNNRFPHMKQYVKDMVLRDKLTEPSVVYYKNEDNQLIFNLITKKYYHHKPIYDDIMSCLILMKEFCIKNNIEFIAMPKIGCGLDKHEWKNIQKMILTVFYDTDIKILIKYL